MGRKEDQKRKEEAAADREVVANFRAESERESFWKDLMRYDPRCSHCQRQLTTRRNQSVLVIDRLSCLDHVEAVTAAAMADNSNRMPV